MVPTTVLSILWIDPWGLQTATLPSKPLIKGSRLSLAHLNLLFALYWKTLPLHFAPDRVAQDLMALKGFQCLKSSFSLMRILPTAFFDYPMAVPALGFNSVRTACHVESWQYSTFRDPAKQQTYEGNHGCEWRRWRGRNVDVEDSNTDEELGKNREKRW